MTPFQVLREDADEVIGFINCIIETTPADASPGKAAPAAEKKEKRIRVDSKTATGGWF